MESTSKTRFVVCIANEGCEDLELRKLYAVVSNDEPEEPGYVRIVDESGEDYLYPSKYFLPVELPEEVAGAVLAV
jgi:hypothetical protein